MATGCINAACSPHPGRTVLGPLMGDGDVTARSSDDLARSALKLTVLLSLIGSGLGVVGIWQGVVAGLETILILSCVLFSSAMLVSLFRSRDLALQAHAIAATVYFTLYLCAGSIIAITGSASHRFNLFIFLVWFFPLLVFNKLVNAPVAGRYLANGLMFVPIVIVGAFSARLAVIFRVELMFVFIAYCLSYLGFAVLFNVVTRYREHFVTQRERAEALKVEAAVLESISDCFIALDSSLRLVYLNDAACAEFTIVREASLGKALFDAVGDVCTEPMGAGLQAAFGQPAATVFEAQNREADRWYEMRCFPRGAGLSIYFRNITKRRATDARIARLAFYDALTDLPNRTHLRQRLEAALANGAVSLELGALLFIDLDDFKTLNDALGHDAGDRFLKEAALRLRSSVGAQDIVSRFGGDEFVVLLEELGREPQVANDHAIAVAQKILRAFAQPYRIDEVEYTSTAAIGIAYLSGEPDSVDDIVKRADLAMYRAKAKGRNSFCVFNPAMQTAVASRARLQSDLRVAVSNRQFALHYQPLVNRYNRTIGAEALLRWKHVERGMVPPDEFIPLAEEAGLIGELGRWVLETACQQLAQWANDIETSTLTLAVNVSLRQFTDETFVDTVLEVVRETGADPLLLKLEITESSAMLNVHETIAKMAALAVHGIAFSIDDFGTGYSSLSHLKRLPLNQLKIDRSFVSDITTDLKGASIVRTLIELARSLELQVIAEGVETREQRELLEREGCYLYQGYLFSRALAIDDFDACRSV